LLLQPLLGGLAGVDGAGNQGQAVGDLVLGWSGLLHAAPSFGWPRRKNRYPLTCEPVTALATAEREPYTCPSYSKPSARTRTRSVSALYGRVITVPGGGKRSSGWKSSVRVAVSSGGAVAALSFGAVERRSALHASSSARFRARSDWSPSAFACSRQA